MKMNYSTSDSCANPFGGRTGGVHPLSATIILIASLASAQGQGTITFSQSGGITQTYYEYSEQGMRFRVVAPPPQPIADDMLLLAGGIGSHPNNGTPHMEFNRSYGFASNYVVFSPDDGSMFGLLSVDLAEPYAPSYAQIPITFSGFYEDGSMVSTTFTTPGNGTSSFQTYLFGPEFGSGLVRVDIPSANWAMDNIVFVPEPGTVSLLILGLLAVGWQARRNRRRSPAKTPT